MGRFLGGAGAAPAAGADPSLGEVGFCDRFFRAESVLAREETVCSEPPKHASFLREIGNDF